MSKFFDESASAQRAEATATAPADPYSPQASGSLTQHAATVLAGKNGQGCPPPSFHDGVARSRVMEGPMEGRRLIHLPQAGPKTFLAMQQNPAMQAAVEAYRTLRTRLAKQQAASGARSLVVSSPAHGEGKTLTAFNLCLCYTQIPDGRVLAVDADLRTRGLSRLLHEAESPGLASILAGASEPSAVVLGAGVPGLYVLPAGHPVQSPVELFSGENWREFMRWAARTFRLVIVDSPPALTVSDFDLILAHCESALLVARARRSSVESLGRILAQVDSAKLAGVVFNAADETSNPGYGFAAIGRGAAGGSGRG